MRERYVQADDRALAFPARFSQDRDVRLRLVAEEVVSAARTRARQASRDSHPAPGGSAETDRWGSRLFSHGRGPLSLCMQGRDGLAFGVWVQHVARLQHPKDH